MADASTHADGRAVFLSYASQDKEVAARICEALRAAGVEVWFDQSELRGGDAWDAKIRRQIKECTLFVPVITPNTNARAEGYFRLEWKLAVDRSHLMADDEPFLFPIVVGDVNDATARVPDKFREVQWTRLRLDETPAELGTRVAKMLRGGEASLDDARGRRPATLRQKPRWQGWMFFPIAGTIIGLLFAALPMWKAINRPARRDPPKADGPVSPVMSAPGYQPAKPVTEKMSPNPEVAGLLAKVRVSFDRIDALHTELDTMEGLLGQAARIDPTDASIWALWARLDCRYLSELYDPSAARRDAARRHAAQANGLDPVRPDVRLAQALVMMQLARDDATKVASAKILDALLTEIPQEGQVPLALGWLAFDPAQPEGALEWFDRAARIPGNTARALFAKGIALSRSGRLAEAVPEFDRALASERAVKILLWKAYVLTIWDGDLDAANRALDEVPAQFFVEDMAAVTRYYVLLLSRKYAEALTAMRAVPHDYLQSVAYSGPAGYFKGNALALAGKHAAAELEWRSALAAVERRLTIQPNEQEAMQFKALLQVSLGDRAAGLRTYQAVRELYGEARNQVEQLLQMQLLPADEAVAWTARKAAAGDEVATVAQLRLDPVYDPIRTHPRFGEIVAQAEADPRLSPHARLRKMSLPAAPTR